MMNPDGVEVGNARCDALGFDINRVWGKTVRKDLHPTVHAFHDLVRNIDGETALVLDLHGHSRR